MSIQGHKIVKLTPQSILERVDSYSIFKYYIPAKGWSLNRAISSPLRKDNIPSFIISNKGNTILFVDLATGDKGDCFTFVKKLYDLSSLNDVLTMIDKDFNLGISSGERKESCIIKIEVTDKEEEHHHYSFIQVIPRKFTALELQYWNEYHQDITDLKKENVFAIDKVYLNRRLYTVNSSELRFGYYYENLGWKIYCPFSKNKSQKWLSNIPLITTEGLETLSIDHNSLIAKSKKDYMVCKKIYPNICYVQNESIMAFSEKTISYISENSKKVFYGGDSDVPGKKASYIITETLGYTHINPPDRLLPTCKDFAEWGRIEGLNSLETHFKCKGLL